MLRRLTGAGFETRNRLVESVDHRSLEVKRIKVELRHVAANAESCGGCRHGRQGFRGENYGLSGLDVNWRNGLP